MQHHLIHAEHLIEEKKHGEALALLREVDISVLDESDAAWYEVLVSEAALVEGVPDLVRDLSRAIEIFRFHPDAARFARAKYAQGVWLIHQAEYPEAQQVLLEAYTNFLRYKDLNGVAKSLNRLACVSHHMGDTESAIDELEKSLRLYRGLEDPDGTASIAANLPLPLLRSGRIRDTLRQCEESAPYLDNSRPRMKIVFSLVSAMPHAILGDTGKALEVMARIEPILDEYPFERVFYYQYLGWIHLSGGNFRNAEKVLLEGSQLAEKLFPGQLIFTTGERMLAECYFGTGKVNKAAEAVDRVYPMVSKINERGEIAACYRLFAQIDYHKKSRESARTWFERSLDLFYLLKSRYELAVTRYLASCTTLFSDDDRMKMLRQAMDYFRSESIEPYTGRVEQQVSQLEQSNKPLRPPDSGRVDTGGRIIECPDVVIGASCMREILNLAERAAPGDINILLTGETGTGKDVLARYIHYHSKRPGRFVSVNAAAVPDSMVESELFGYARGAFTGADIEKEGLFEAAHEGTFFLDEIADASPSFQAKLLEVIENRSVRRLGETSAKPVNFRLIAATNQDLDSRISDRRFRADLFHRLNQMELHLPQLSDRFEDFRPLIDYFLRTSGIDPTERGLSEVIDKLASHLALRPWPGNVRQLRAEINRLVLMSGRDVLKMVKIVERTGRNSDENRKLLDALKQADGNQSEAARILGIPESTLRYRLKKYGSKNGK